jgi:hypothetical protein
MLGMTVARMRAEMSNAEHGQWMVYVGRQAQRAELAARSKR